MARRFTNNTQFPMYLCYIQGQSSPSPTDHTTTFRALTMLEPNGGTYNWQRSEGIVVCIESTYPVNTPVQIRLGTASATDWAVSNTAYNNFEYYNETTGDYEMRYMKPLTENFFNGTSTTAVTISSNVTPPSTQPITVNVTTPSAVARYTYTTTPVEPVQGEPLVIALSPTSGYRITNITCTDNNGNSYNAINNTITITETSDIMTVDVVVTTDNATSTIGYSATQCSFGEVTVNPTTWETGTTVTLTITANSGYIIDTWDLTSYNNASGNYEVVPFVLNEDATQLTAVWDCPVLARDIVGSVYTDVQPVITVNGGIMSIYVPTDDELGQIGAKRYQANPQGQLYDLGEFIMNLFKSFVDIPVVGKNACVLGDYNTRVIVDVADTDVIDVDMGSFQLTGKQGNILDYNETIVEFYLPFIGTVTIDTYKCIDKTIKLVYKCNIVTGDCNVLVYADDIIIDTEEGSFVYNVPYILNSMLYNKEYGVNTGYMLEKTPYVILRYREQLGQPKTYERDTEVVIGDITGYSTFTDVELVDTTATEQELQEIESLLNTGIIV